MAMLSNQMLFPIGSMYAIYGNIYHQYIPNVSIYTSTSRILWYTHQSAMKLGYDNPSIEYDLNMSGIRFSGMIFGDPFDDWVWKTEMAIEFTEARLSMLENEWYPSQWQFVKWF
jgi:hypothetical protein